MNRQDHHASQSDEATPADQFQAKPLEDRRHNHDDNSPAPMLPNISPVFTNNSIQAIENTEVDTPHAPHHHTEESQKIAPDPVLLRRQAQSNEPSLNLKPKQANVRKTMIGIATTLIALVGFSTVWYNANQDVYTFNSSDGAVAQRNQPDNDDKTQSSQPSTLGAEDSQPHHTFTLTNMPELPQGFYQLWYISSDKTTSLGAFIMKDNQPVELESNQPFKPDFTNVSHNDQLIVTIQAGDSPAESPSSTQILAGKVTSDQVQLSFSAIDLSNAEGVYTIAAPSDLSGQSQTAGIWFAATDGQQFTGPGLKIPHAPEGWAYEGQVIYKDIAITTGRFSQPNQSDSFFGFTPNPSELPSNFPGEDYLQNAPEALDIDFPADLANGQWQIVISLEPDQDGQDPTGDDTFAFQPFKATIPENAKTYQEYALERDLSKLPTATITLK